MKHVYLLTLFSLNDQLAYQQRRQTVHATYEKAKSFAQSYLKDAKNVDCNRRDIEMVKLFTETYSFEKSGVYYQLEIQKMDLD